MTINAYRFAASVVFLSIIGVICGGCPAPAPAPPLPEAILAGTWRLTTDNVTNLPGTTVVFDANGNLTSVTYVAADTTITQTPISGSTVVNGSVVAISQTFPNGSRMEFAGTLNTTATQIQGSLVLTINQGLFNIFIDNEPATLTRL